MIITMVRIFCSSLLYDKQPQWEYSIEILIRNFLRLYIIQLNFISQRFHTIFFFARIPRVIPLNRRCEKYQSLLTKKIFNCIGYRRVDTSAGSILRTYTVRYYECHYWHCSFYSNKFRTQTIHYSRRNSRQTIFLAKKQFYNLKFLCKTSNTFKGMLPYSHMWNSYFSQWFRINWLPAVIINTFTLK